MSGNAKLGAARLGVNPLVVARASIHSARNLYFGAGFSGTTSAAALLTAGTTPNVAIAADRMIRVTLALRNSSGTVAGDYFAVGIDVDGAVSDTHVVFIYSAAAGSYLPASMFPLQFDGTLAAGDHTFAATAQRSAGTGTLTLAGRLIVDDMGPA